MRMVMDDSIITAKIMVYCVKELLVRRLGRHGEREEGRVGGRDGWKDGRAGCSCIRNTCALAT